MKHLRTRIWLVGILVLGIALRLLWLYNVDTQPISDFKHYNDLAMSLLRTGHYQMPEGIDYIKQSTPYLKQGAHYPTAFRPPGYPLFLAVLYWIRPTLMMAKMMNVLLSAIWIYCTYLLGRRYFGARVGLWAAGITAVFPIAIGYTSVLGTEILSVTLLMIILCIQAYQVGPRVVRCLLLGVLIGFLSLVKPYFAIYPVLHLLFEYWITRRAATSNTGHTGTAKWAWKPQLRSLLISLVWTVLAMAIMISPWTYRNYVVFHRFVPISTNGSFVLYINNNDASHGIYLDAMKVPNSVFKTSRVVEPDGTYNEVDAMKVAQSEAMKWIETHPLGFVRLGIDRLSESYLSVGSEILPWALEPGKTTMNAKQVQFFMQLAEGSGLVIVGGGLLYALFALRPLLRRKPMEPLHKVNAVLIVFFTVVIFGSEGQPRYVFPLYPFFILGICWLGVQINRLFTIQDDNAHEISDNREN